MRNMNFSCILGVFGGYIPMKNSKNGKKPGYQGLAPPNQIFKK